MSRRRQLVAALLLLVVQTFQSGAIAAASPLPRPSAAPAPDGEPPIGVSCGNLAFTPALGPIFLWWYLGNCGPVEFDFGEDRIYGEDDPAGRGVPPGLLNPSGFTPLLAVDQPPRVVSIPPPDGGALDDGDEPLPPCPELFREFDYIWLLCGCCLGLIALLFLVLWLVIWCKPGPLALTPTPTCAQLLAFLDWLDGYESNPYLTTTLQYQPSAPSARPYAWAAPDLDAQLALLGLPAANGNPWLFQARLITILDLLRQNCSTLPGVSAMDPLAPPHEQVTQLKRAADQPVILKPF